VPAIEATKLLDMQSTRSELPDNPI
jgi:hypothetical protein